MKLSRSQPEPLAPRWSYPSTPTRTRVAATLLLALWSTFSLAASKSSAQSPASPPSSARPDSNVQQPSPSPFGDADRWVPSLSLTLGFSFHAMEGEVSSLNLTDGSEARPTVDDDKVARSPIAGGRLGLLSPSLPIPLRPRLFLEGEIAAVSNQKRRVAREGTPTGINQPSANPIDGRFDIREETITGVGSVTNADMKNRQYGAAVGLFIPFEVGEWSFALKPGARYLRRTMEFDGRVLAAKRGNLPRTAPDTATQQIVLLGDDELDLNAIGPSLELEIDVARWWDNVGASLFVGGGAYRIVGNRDVSFSGTTTAPDPETGVPETFQANFSSEVDPWIFHGSVGLRVRWQGFRPGWLGRGEGGGENRWRDRRPRSRSSR